MHHDCHSVVASDAIIDDTFCVSDSLETLVRRHHEELLRVLRARLPSEQDAADLAQEAYARMIRYQGELSEDELKRMLFRIAQNLLTDHWRWRRLRGIDTHLPIDGLDVEIESAEPNHDRHVESAQRLARLEEIILAMPDKRRTVFLLSRIEGLTNAQIAERCGVAIKTVEKHLANALAACRAQERQDDSQSS